MNYFIQSQQCSNQSAFLCDSHTKNHNDPQQKAGGQKWPLAISVEISSIWSPQAKQWYFSWHWLSRVANIYDTDQIKTHFLHSVLICIYSVRWSAHLYNLQAVYVVGEVFPWGGNSVIFSVCASISSTGVQLHEIDIWLDPRSLNEFYGALMFPKVNIIVK